MYTALNKGYRNWKRTNMTSRLSSALARQRSGRGAAVAAARSLNSAVRGMQLAQGEFKCVDIAQSLSSDTASAVQLLNGIARGDEINERAGREVVMRSIQVKGIAAVTVGTGIDQVCRVMIVYDRQTNAAALTAAMVLNAVDTYSPRNLENRRRFKIMYDRSFVLNASGEAGSHCMFNFYRKLNHPVTFNSGDAATVADITTGSMYLICIGNVAAGATDGTCTFSSRIRYQDK